MQLFNIPNLLTLINLFSGCMAVVFIFGNHVEQAMLCTLISLVADFFDGMAARALKTPQGVGKELDSLADVVSFGVVPGFILKFMLFNSLISGNYHLSDTMASMVSNAGFLFTLFAALRLAKFNVDTRQSDSFVGLATPAATIFVVGVYVVFDRNSFGLFDLLHTPYFVFGILASLCYLMIAEIPMFSFKLKSKGWNDNKLPYSFIGLAVILLILLKFAALPLIIFIYVLVSITQKLIKT